MANYTSETQNVQRVRYLLNTPDNAVELGKLLSVAVQAWQTNHPGVGLSDDTIHVSVEDERIVLWWEQKTLA